MKYPEQRDNAGKQRDRHQRAESKTIGQRLVLQMRAKYHIRPKVKYQPIDDKRFYIFTYPVRLTYHTVFPNLMLCRSVQAKKRTSSIISLLSARFDFFISSIALKKPSLSSCAYKSFIFAA